MGSPNTSADATAPRSLSVQVGAVVVARAIAFVLAFGVPIVMVRLLEQTEYGTYRQALLVFSFFWMILQFGVTQSLYFFYPREVERRDALVTQTILALVAMALIGGVALVAGREQVGTYFRDPFMAEVAPLVGLFLGCMLVTSVLDVLPIVQQRSRLAFWVIVGFGALRAAAVLGATIVTRDVKAILLALVGFSVARVCFMLVLLHRQGLLRFGRLRQGFLREQLVYAAPLGLVGIVVSFVQMVDRLYVPRFFSTAEFAVYSVGAFHLPIINIIFQSATSVMLGRMSALQSAGRVADMIELQREAMRKLGLLALPVFGASLLFAEDVITTLYTREYAGAVPVFLVFSVLILRSATVSSIVPRAFGLTAWMFRASLVTLPVALGLVLSLAPVVGLAGPAIAVAAALWLLSLLQLRKTGQLLEASAAELYPWGDFGRTATLVALVTLVVGAGRALIGAPTLVNVMVGGVLYFALYGALAVRFGVVRRSELAEAIEGLRRRLPGARS